jgi:hypothetical protein
MIDLTFHNPPIADRPGWRMQILGVKEARRAAENEYDATYPQRTIFHRQLLFDVSSILQLKF